MSIELHAGLLILAQVNSDLIVLTEKVLVIATVK